MKVSVVRLWENGLQIPRWQYNSLPVAVGELRLQEGRDEHLRRHLRTAYLIDTGRYGTGQSYDVIPPLVDAAILWIKNRQLSISGYERGDLTPTYAQTWVVEILSLDAETKIPQIDDSVR